VVVKIKICGITNLEDALCVVEYGADMLGFVFWERSPRSITPAAAALIIQELPPSIMTVGVFVDEPAARVNEVVERAGLTIAQLHGAESPEYCSNLEGRYIKVLRVKDADALASLSDYHAEAILLDTFVKGQPGGTGASFDWSLLKDMDYDGDIILAGGLTPDNIEEALAHYLPYGVDISSGVEAEPGKKDPEKVRKFIEKVRGFNNV